MTSGYHLLEKFNEGLVGLTSYKYGKQMWALCKTKKPFTCSISCENYEAGEMAFRPVGNPQNRMHRIAEGEMK